MRLAGGFAFFDVVFEDAQTERPQLANLIQCGVVSFGVAPCSHRLVRVMHHEKDLLSHWFDARPFRVLIDAFGVDKLECFFALAEFCCGQAFIWIKIVHNVDVSDDVRAAVGSDQPNPSAPLAMEWWREGPLIRESPL